MSNVDLKKIKAEMKLVGTIQFAAALGYRSVNTIFTWFNNDEIPGSAMPALEAYFQKKKKQRRNGKR